MTAEQKRQSRALITVFEDKLTAMQAVKTLHEAGFSTDEMELVTHDFKDEAPDVETPKVHETTSECLIEAAEKWGAIGAGTGIASGLIAAVLTGFPGIAIASLLMGGVTGAMMGGMAGLEDAADDDSVDLPNQEDYEKLLHSGHQIVVVHGTHDDVMRAKAVISELPQIHQHLHAISGREFHEHDSRPKSL